MSRPTAAALAAIVLLAPTIGIGAQREHVTTERYSSPAGQTVFVDVADLDVSVRGADVTETEVRTELRIAAFGEERAARWIEQRVPEVAVAPERLAITARPQAAGFLDIGHLTARARVGLVVPHVAVPDITTTNGDIHVRGDFPTADPLHLRTASGDMELEGAARTVDVHTASGDTRVQLLRPVERFEARSSSGNVTLSGGARWVRVDTSSGDVWLAGLSGPARVESSSGRVTLIWDRIDPGTEVRVRSSTGRVRLVIPSDARPRGILRTTAGSIASDFPGNVAETGDAVELTGDGPVLDVETASGEIVLTTSG